MILQSLEKTSKVDMAMRLSASYLANAAFAFRKRNWLQLAAFAMMSGGLMMSAACAQSASGWIELKPEPGRHRLQITGHALALDAVSGMDFALSIRRQNKGNTSSARQSGRFDLGPSETKVLSSTSINIEPGDELTIELKLLDHGAEISRATVISKSAPEGQTL
jgi:hypothetical protein